MSGEERDLYVGTAAQIAQWLAWPGKNGSGEADLLDLDAFLDSVAQPPRPFEEYAELVFWDIPGRPKNSRHPAWVRETLHAGVPTRLAPFPVDTERAMEEARDVIEEATRTAPQKRVEYLTEVFYQRLVATEAAEELRAAEKLRELVGERVKRTAREFAKEPKPQVIMDQVLAAEVNLLAGPEASGKSLWTRDLALCVASGHPWRGHVVPEPRNVLLAFSEGTHDFAERYESHPLWEAAADRIWIIDQPINLVAGSDTDWLLREYADERPGFMLLDVIYGFGLSDDTGTKDVLPVLKSMKRISAEWQAATMAVGHPPHGDARRMRGASMWRQLAYTDWFMGDGRLTQEKSKIGRASAQVHPYMLEYPALRWLSSGEFLAEEALRFAVIEASLDADPKMSVRRRATLLAPDLGCSVERARKLIDVHLKTRPT